MSRSYKKTPWCGDNKGKVKKRIANYKKVYETWDICDYGWVYSWKTYWNKVLKDYIEHPDYYKNPPNKKEEYRYWYKTYKMK